MSKILRIAHSMQAPRFFEETGSMKFAGSSKKMDGALKRIDEKTIKRFPRWDKSMDTLLVKILLESAQVNLDDFSDDVQHSTDTIRRRGVFLYGSITYSNVGTENIRYYYRINKIPESEYRIKERISHNATHRMLRKRSGIKLSFVQTGTVGRFSFQKLFIQIASGMGMLTLITTIVDFIAMRFMPMRKYYGHYKYELSADFSDIKDEGITLSQLSQFQRSKTS